MQYIILPVILDNGERLRRIVNLNKVLFIESFDSNVSTISPFKETYSTVKSRIVFEIYQEALHCELSIDEIYKLIQEFNRTEIA